jgi:hypothetical protein
MVAVLDLDLALENNVNKIGKKHADNALSSAF